MRAHEESIEGKPFHVYQHTIGVKKIDSRYILVNLGKFSNGKASAAWMPATNMIAAPVIAPSK